MQTQTILKPKQPSLLKPTTAWRACSLPVSARPAVALLSQLLLGTAPGHAVKVPRNSRGVTGGCQHQAQPFHALVSLLNYTKPLTPICNEELIHNPIIFVVHKQNFINHITPSPPPNDPAVPNFLLTPSPSTGNHSSNCHILTFFFLCNFMVQ